MSFSSEKDVPDSEQFQQILQNIYSNGEPDMVFIWNVRAFLAETLDKKRCVAEHPSFIPPSPSSSCLVYSYYVMIKQFQENYVKNLKRESLNLENESLLNFFVSRWNIFESGSIKLDSVCQPLYVHFSRYHLNLTTYKIYVLALRFWHSHCSSLTGKVIGIVMHMINKERRGESINTPLVHESMRLLVNINYLIEGHYHYGMPRQIGSFRKRALPTEFIYQNNVCRFYKRESVVMLSQCSADSYLRKVKNILADEYTKCIFSYNMPQHIARYVQRSLSEIFIGNKKSVLISAFKNALADHRTAVLKDFYSILRAAKNSDLFKIFSKAFCDNVILDGKNIMERRVEEFIKHPELYMVTFLQIMKKYTALVVIIFYDNEYFKNANEKALSSILNHSITSENKATLEPCKYFAIYCDFMLKKPNDDTANTINELTCLFEYLETKYLFDKTFNELLVKSLICATTVTEIYENNIILFVETFRKISHNLITKEKIKDIIKDIRTSENLTKKFATEKSIDSVDSDGELVVKILKDENWPFAKQSFTGPLPRSLSLKIDSFSAFHKKNNEYKNLTFLHQITRAEVVTHCFGKEYNLHVNLNQLVLLLQFNKAEIWSSRQLLENTKIDQKTFDHVIQNFIEAGILKYKGDDHSNSKASVMLNLDYENENDCVRLSDLKDAVQEAVEASKKTHDYVISEENKCISIQAAIVRIMKAELFLHHEELVTRTFEALKTKFDFTSDMVNKNIDVLIEKGYIERSEVDERLYFYIP